MKSYKGNYRWFLVMTLGTLLAAIPGFVLAPYGIQVFDEPYQIINGMEWKTSNFSPLSAWLTFQIGSICGWKYLVFRYLAVGLLLISIYIASVYAFISSTNKRRIALWSILVVLMAMSYRLPTYYTWLP